MKVSTAQQDEIQTIRLGKILFGSVFQMDGKVYYMGENGPLNVGKNPCLNSYIIGGSIDLDWSEKEIPLSDVLGRIVIEI